MAESKVYASLRRYVDAEVVDYASVADSRGVFAWRAVFDGFDEDFDGVFARAQVDDFEGLFRDVGDFGFFARILAWSHEVVD